MGLVKSYYFGGIGTAKNAPGYKGNLDYGVGAMYKAAEYKGGIADMPDKEGVLVMTKDFGHVGVYIGNGRVVECTLSGFGDGVVKTEFSQRKWAWWCQCPCIEDDTGVTEKSFGLGASVCGTGKTKAPLNVRAEASIKGNVIAKLKPGAEVKLTGRTKADGGYIWAEIMYGGKPCWCDRQWIESV